MTPEGNALALAGTLGITMFLIGRLLGRYEATRPLTKLKAGLTYRIDGVLWRSDEHLGLAVSWHEGYGHYEYRIANLDADDFTCEVNVGDSVEVARERVGPPYAVQRA